jgi:hypothetical protein
MNTDKLEDIIKSLVSAPVKEDFLYDFLRAYGLPKASITRLKKGDYNLSKNKGEVIWKKKLFFREETKADLHALIDKLSNDQGIQKHHPRFIIVTDFKIFLAVDTSTKDTLDISLNELPQYYDFFLPWAGIEKSQFQNENPADIKAAERMGRLYDLILETNQVTDEDSRHALNVFLSRLLFCFFAEDTGIFPDNLFINALASHTEKDGSDLQAYLTKLFNVLNIEDRSGYPQYLTEFPYVNGGLFAHEYPVPTFNKKSRDIIIECGSLNWKGINPDIFGSMMQAVVHTDQRSGLGMHYTSVANIMKVIEPLFLNDLYEELEKAGSKKGKLLDLLDRLSKIKIFDPACGSGNFLIIAYKELCKLEIKIFKQLDGDERSLFSSNIKLTQFYGIEIDDFAHETAKLSLWLAQHQMNLAFQEVFNVNRPTLPLKAGGNIVCGNATRMDWEEVCPKAEDSEVYILGNPPYLGSRYQKKFHKDDISVACSVLEKYKKVDYITCWFIKASSYIENSDYSFAFVSTNSICQGEQVELIWPYIFSQQLEIFFAHQSFKWTNNAKGNAGVTCVVIGLQKAVSNRRRIIYKGLRTINVRSINAYLSSGSNTVIKKRSYPLSIFPKMESGNKANDGGNLILSPNEKNSLISSYPEAKKYIRKTYGAHEFLNGAERWSLWIEDKDLNKITLIPPIVERVNKVREVRLNSRDKGAQKLAGRPHQFREMKKGEEISLICPTVSSERRNYIPLGYLEANDVVIAPNQVIYDPDPYIFAILSSRMHMTWVRSVAGRLKTDYRYSSALCYNTFPFPKISEKQKEILDDHVFNILDEREKYSEKTMAKLYDPDHMPEGLLKAHHEMDLAVEKCYRKRPFNDDAERLEYLFKLYEEMIEAEK